LFHDIYEAFILARFLELLRMYVLLGFDIRLGV
jgi:hypothetical protein